MTLPADQLDIASEIEESERARGAAMVRAECERLRQSMLRPVTMYCAAAMKSNATDAELEQYLSAGIAQLEAECAALADELTTINRQWIPVSERMPEPNKKVLATYTNVLGNPRRVIAEFVAKHTVESRAEDWGDWEEYDELTDTYFCPEGWYERVENWGDLSHLFIGDGEITHWMPLPDAPKGELK